MKHKAITKAANLEVGQTVFRNWIDHTGREKEGWFEIVGMRTCDSGVLLSLKDGGGVFDAHIIVGAGSNIPGFKIIKDRPRQMEIRD